MQRAERPRLWRLRVRARAERTENMEPIAVTLEVSRLSGWLNADMLCRAEGKHKRAYVRIGRREGLGTATAHAACRKAPTVGLRVGNARSAPKTCRLCS